MVQILSVLCVSYSLIVGSNLPSQGHPGSMPSALLYGSAYTERGFCLLLDPWVSSAGSSLAEGSLSPSQHSQKGKWWSQSHQCGTGSGRPPARPAGSPHRAPGTLSAAGPVSGATAASSRQPGEETCRERGRGAGGDCLCRHGLPSSQAAEPPGLLARARPSGPVHCHRL